jgi:zinc finger BED domain-containing protein 1 (E3 SUMO-protein ligase ZBED1)
LAQFFINYSIETKSALCLLCKTTVKKSGDSTFNFVRHVKRHHLDAYNTWTKTLVIQEEKMQSKQPSIKDAMSSPRGTKYTSAHPRQMELSKMVTNDLIIGLVLPLSIVERPEFLRAMHTVDPKFVVPSRRSICRDILPKAIEKVESELKRICKLSRFVSLTLDMWTDRRMRCFYAITIHLIEQCLFKSHLLAFKHLSGMFLKLCKFTQIFIFYLMC